MSATTTTANNAAHKLRRQRSISRPIDAEAMNIRFGIELETKVPRTCGIAVGGYPVGARAPAALDQFRLFMLWDPFQTES